MAKIYQFGTKGSVNIPVLDLLKRICLWLTRTRYYAFESDRGDEQETIWGTDGRRYERCWDKYTGFTLYEFTNGDWSLMGKSTDEIKIKYLSDLAMEFMIMVINIQNPHKSVAPGAHGWIFWYMSCLAHAGLYRARFYLLKRLLCRLKKAEA